MLIVCPSCLSAYRMPAAAVRRTPAAVRCAECGNIFEPVEMQSVLATVPSDDPGSMIAGSAPALPAQRTVRSLPQSARRSPTRWRALPAVLAAALTVALLSFACLERDRLVQLLPETAPVFAALHLPVAGLQLGRVETALGDEGPVKVLTLETSITNTRSTDVRLPNVKIVVRDDTEQSLYSWTAPAPRERLGPGEAVAFRSRLVSPPPNGHDLVVSFADFVDETAPIGAKSKP